MNKAFKFAPFFLTLILAVSALSMADDVIKTEYVGRDMKGAERWQANTQIRKKEGDIYILTQKGQGVYSSFNGPISWKSEMEFKSTDETVIPLKLVKRVFDEKGDTIRLEKQDYDPAANKVTCLHRDFPANISREKEFDLTKPAVNKLLLAPYVQKMLSAGKQLSKVQMVSEEPGLYDIDIKVVKTEDVEINDRKVKAIKLQFDPRLGLLNAAKVFFPKSYVWHSALPDHEWLKFQGLEGDISSVKAEVTIKD